MFKLFLFIIILSSFLNADDKVEVYATTMHTKDNIVEASEEVVVIYKDYHLSAQRATYDRNNGELELFGNIRATQGENIKLLGDYAKLNIAKKERIFKPFHMLEKKSNVWVSGSTGFSKDINTEIKSGVTSGCDPNDPLWTMEFSSAAYNSDTMWLSLYNARIYIHDIAVFYIPYFGYSLDTTRRTGILPPMVGHSSSEGFYYDQALFIAEYNWWDLEIKPQIRTNRGFGAYSTFRFVDSKTSKGTFTAGHFKEKEDYFIKNKLANKTHYGFDFNYDNSDFLNQWLGTNFEGQSGLYADIVNMNDVDYINLYTNDTTKTDTSTQLLSRINLFYNTDNNYIGTYFKYYKDLELKNNDSTLQNLPAIHYHKYLDALLGDHLMYNLDIKSNNYYRDFGENAIQTNINIPITLQTSLFGEYLNVSYQSNIYAQHTSFNGGDKSVPTIDFNDGLFARNYHVLSASSQQARAYDELTHVVDFGGLYTVGGSETRDGYYEEQKDFCSIAANKSQAICEFYNITDVEENLQLYFSQYVYDISGKQIIYHRLAQNFSYEKVNGGAGELENELDYQITDSINFYNNMLYNYDEGSFSKNFNKILYKSQKFDLGFSHMYKNDFSLLEGNDKKYINYITSTVSYKYDKHYTYSARYDYDIEKSQKKSAEIGFMYKKRCWDFGIRYVENNRPILNNIGQPDSIKDRYIYFTIALKPIMSSDNKSSGFVFRFPEET